ncbi:hypothetical protein FHU10_3761 [Serratia fonticola]|uniref:Uncharacterized protein n=1 Tax=Serratia fonticola TaxID=47917 RepID=A0A542D0P9_SERFO|nr:hypothetical protein FHU09_3946 [Serratia fonticola]TQI96647.1 hypothetical protein FHU11_2100 [Serratia fonticola]TVZ71144.1 hypothetical protein FHU10_3761 [Serratia fonticola]
MSNRVTKLITNLLNYAAEALIGTSVLMFLVSFFAFSHRDAFIQFNKLTFSAFAIGILFLFIAKKIKSRFKEY